jgi:hypothetical protein
MGRKKGKSGTRAFSGRFCSYFWIWKGDAIFIQMEGPAGKARELFLRIKSGEGQEGK